MKENRGRFIAVILVLAVLAAGAVFGMEHFRNKGAAGETAAESRPTVYTRPEKAEKEQSSGEPAADSSYGEPAEGSEAPDFSVIRLSSGKTVHLSDLKGKPVILNFWATYCPPCREEFPAYQKMFETYGDEVEFVMINTHSGESETDDKVVAFIDENGYTFPVYLDQDMNACMAYGVMAIPTTVAIDADGVIRTLTVGGLSEEEIEERIKEILP